MKTASMKEFFKDLFTVATTTLDGLAATLVVIFFIARALYLFIYQGGPASTLAEGSLYSVIAVLMLVRLRHDAPAELKVHWGALASVVAFAICILTLR